MGKNIRVLPLGGHTMRALGLATIAVIALAATPTAAANLSIKDLVGRWCSAAKDYTFTRTRLTVTMHGGGTGIYEIARVEASPQWLNVTWRKGGNTVFFKFSADRRQMFQHANETGDMGPEREFHRC